METNKTTPQYTRIQNYILERIKTGEYPIGSKIPSENELAEQFGVSRITANKALKELACIGLVERIRGSGTYVCANPNISTASKAFVSAVKIGITGHRSHQLIQFRTLRGYPELLDKYGMTEPALFYEIVMVNKDGERNESVDYSYIPCSLVGDLTPHLESLRTRYVYDFLGELDGVSPQFMKIFVNVPHHDFLDAYSFLIGSPKSCFIWSTDVYDAGMQMLACTYTVAPSTSLDVPLLTFSLLDR